VWPVDQRGLLTRDMTGLRDYQKPYARDPGEVTGWATGGGRISLLDAIRHVAPTILIGTSPEREE
jgi:malate dehydrogenase (oxaloacetate-decarboxylating)